MSGPNESVELLRYTLADGTSVVVETVDRSRVARAGRTDRAVAEVSGSIRQALASVTSAASDVLAQFRSMHARPDEVEIQFGVSFDAKFGAVIASASAGGHLEVTLRWNRASPPADEEPS